MARILIVDDNETVREGAAEVLVRTGQEVLQASSGARGLELAKDQPVDLVITDLKMEGMDGLEVLARVRALDDEIAVLVITAFGTVESAVAAIKGGAFDYVQKPFSPAVLRHKVERALEWRRDRQRLSRLEATQEVLSGRRDRAPEPVEGDAFEGMVGQSPAMQRVVRMIRKVAPSDTSVALCGESGTGKELAASAIHHLSARSEGPLIKVNCGAIPETLMESELFGHEKGAFTGAIKRKLGRFELADGGTIFLDEVGELPLSMQVKLLRVLQERTVDRVGGERPVAVDVRVISATNKRLADEVEAGRFREDLFYRLHVVPLELPPLRERTEDIVPLARHFVARLRSRANPAVEGLTEEAERLLEAYHFPGNVRELVNIVEQALVFAEGDRVAPEDLPAQVSGSRAPPTGGGRGPRRGRMSLPEFLETVERQEILEAYERSGGVKTETARRLGLKTSALYYKLEKYGIGIIAGRTPDGPTRGPVGGRASGPAEAGGRPGSVEDLDPSGSES